VGFIALGCPKNVVDSERMLAEIAQAGFIITADAENADVVVINTCGFIAPARDEAIEAIKQAVDCKRNGTVKKVVAAGCLVQRAGEQLFRQVRGIDAIVGLGQRDNIAEIIDRTLRCKGPASYLEHAYQTISDDRVRFSITPQHFSYLRISEGCDHKCSFCTIPSIRGRFRSKPAELILAEAAELTAAGVVELNIIGQDTTDYGRDLKIKDGLAGLCKELEKISGGKWIRLMYLYPAGITDRLIEAIAESERIVHYLDIPIQHINQQILKAMRRGGDKEGIRRLIEKLRAAIPDIVLRTTLIVGFPGETDEQFTELLEFVRWARFDALGSFAYYAEEGTPAADMDGQVANDVKQRRLEELMLTQQQIAFAKNKDLIGSELSCLIDSVDKTGLGQGRYYGQAGDIDSVCIIESCPARPGEFIQTRVVGTRDYDLVVEQI